MKKHWKLLLSALLLVSLLAITACSDNGSDETGGGTGPAGENGSGGEEVVIRDLGGQVFKMVTWWEHYCLDSIDWDDLNFAQEERWRDRQYVEDRYNFRMIIYRYGTYHDVREDVGMHLLAGTRDYQIWSMAPRWFITNQAQGLLAPIDQSHFDPSHGIGWSPGVMEFATIGGNTYGFTDADGYVGGVYFNMRLLEESGIDRHAPFDLQAAGNWNWDTFTDLLRLVGVAGLDETTGERNFWALTAFHQYMLGMALPSNGAAFATLDPATGHLVNATTTDAFRETVEWMVRLRTEMLSFTCVDIGGDWDAFIPMFNDGQGGFRVAGAYVAGNITLADDWGFVAFPTGPRMPAGTHPAWLSQWIRAIPWFFTEDEIDDIMFAFHMWNRPLPEAEDDDWKILEFGRHRDPRSVTESIALHTRNPANFVARHDEILPAGLDPSLSDFFVWPLWMDGSDASYIVESAQLQWEGQLADFNAAMGR